MGRKPSRQVVLLGALLILLTVLAYRNLQPETSPGAAGGARSSTPNPQQAAEVAGLPEVKTAELTRPRPALKDEARNPFVFRPPPPPPPPPPVAKPPSQPDPVVPIGPIEPPPPPPPPPIALKFIGIVDVPRGGRMAVLTDGRAVFHGREGDIIEGRYRVVRIGTESLEIEYSDGRGRQTIRLTGS